MKSKYCLEIGFLLLILFVSEEFFSQNMENNIKSNGYLRSCDTSNMINSSNSKKIRHQNEQVTWKKSLNPEFEKNSNKETNNQKGTFKRKKYRESNKTHLKKPN
jgi:hypothetical protein